MNDRSIGEMLAACEVEGQEVFVEIGLTPRQLAEQHKELLEALKELLDREWQDDEGDYTLEMARERSKAIIAKCEARP